MSNGDASIDATVLTAAMDRLIPAIGITPAAGAMGIAAEVEERGRVLDRHWAGLLALLDALPADFSGLSSEQQDDALRSFEGEDPTHFGLALDLIYTVYYMQPWAHHRLGWHGRTPQPDGNTLEPFDQAVLETARKRAPLWRKV
jgi:hypothetical protein